MAESEEELKSFLMKMKEESEETGFVVYRFFSVCMCNPMGGFFFFIFYYIIYNI